MRKQQHEEQDKKVVDDFVEHLRKHGHPEIGVDCYPDKTNRNSPDIDVIAFPFAIEHTSIDAVENRRRNQNWFEQFSPQLREALEGKVPFYLMLILGFDSIVLSPELDSLRTAFEVWVKTESDQLPVGYTKVEGAAGIPFEFEVEKRYDRPDGLLLSRSLPPIDTFVTRMKDRIDRKSDKLRRYHSRYTTLLLIENGDMALMNKDKMLGAIFVNFPDGPPDGVDQIWYVDTSSSVHTWYIHVTPYLKRENGSIFGKPLG